MGGRVLRGDVGAPVRIGSLFSGIGGLELGLERAGLGSVVWQVEQDEWCRRVLEKHWPSVERFSDVRAVDASALSPVDVLCGGFPCQDVSAAGLRAGIEGNRSGLWREFARLVGQLRPRAVVVENVTSGERAWLPRVQHDLVSAGYRTDAIRIGAADAGAPHRRLRTFVIAVGDADGKGLEERRALGCHCGEEQSTTERTGVARDQTGADAGGAMGGGPHGVSTRLDGHRWPAGRGEAQREWEPPRTTRRGEVQENARRLKALGNAVVPQVAEAVGLMLLARLESAATWRHPSPASRKVTR